MPFNSKKYKLMFMNKNDCFRDDQTCEKAMINTYSVISSDSSSFMKFLLVCYTSL